MRHPVRAVFFDVDFTLIHPGPRFQGVGYQASCARHGIEVDAGKFDSAVAGARQAGMRAFQLARGGRSVPADPEVSVIQSLTELTALL